jgi:hypothetical protein
VSSPTPLCNKSAFAASEELRRKISVLEEWQLFRLPGDGRELQRETFAPWVELDLNPNKIVDQEVGCIELFGRMGERGGDDDAACRTTCVCP